MNWEKLQTFHTLATQGSIVKSAKILSVHPTTVSRRMVEIEKYIGARLIKRKGNQYITTNEGQKVFQIAENMAHQFNSLKQYKQSLNKEISGTVRITTIESFVVNCLLPRMPQLHKQYSQLNLEFISSDLNLSFSKRETDLAIRFSKPSLVNIVHRKLGAVGFALYANSESRIKPTDLSTDEINWVTYDEDYQSLPEARWLAGKMKKAEPIIKSSNAGILKKAIDVGLGVGILPCYRGDKDESLMRISGPEPIVQREAWLLMHDDYRNHPRTLCVINWISKIFNEDKNSISGKLQE